MRSKFYLWFKAFNHISDKGFTFRYIKNFQMQLKKKIDVDKYLIKKDIHERKLNNISNQQNVKVNELLVYIYKMARIKDCS